MVDHKRVTDETEMLKLVLEKYVDETELTDFIAADQDYLQDQYIRNGESDLVLIVK